MNTKKIKALVGLLNEPNEAIYEYLQTEALKQGLQLVPFLEEASLQTTDMQLQKRYANLIHQLQFNHIYTSLQTWKKNKTQNLWDAYFLITKYEYPSLEIETVNAQLASLSTNLWMELSPDMTALEQMIVLKKIFFDKEKFTSDLEDPFGLTNMFLNTVLQNRRGNDITLGIIFQCLAQKQEIPLYGVNLPINYLLAYTQKSNRTQLSKILFYINPYNKGIIFDLAELKKHLKESGMPISENYLGLCTPEDTILRLLYVLCRSYSIEHCQHKVSDIKRLIAIFDHPKEEL